MLSIQYMRFTDQVMLDHLRGNASNGEIHVNYQRVANNLQCARNTVYRSVGRLQAAGHIERKSGNNRIGYTYRVK